MPKSREFTWIKAPQTDEPWMERISGILASVIFMTLVMVILGGCDPQWRKSQSLDDYITTKQIQDEVNRGLEGVRK